MRNVVDIIEDVVSGLTQTIEVTSVSSALGVYTFGVDRTYWARPKSARSLATKVTIGSDEYDIDSMVYNQSISVRTSVDLSLTTSLTIAAPFYINGTQLSANRELKGKNSWEFNPFVWVVEPFSANESNDRTSIISSEPDLTILFLDNDNDDNDTSERYENIIIPLRELAEAFREKIRTTRSTFGKMGDWRVVNHPKFGKTAEQGSISSIINEHTSAVEVRFTVQILKSLRKCQ